MSLDEEYNKAREKYRDDSYVHLEPWDTEIDHLKLKIRGLEGTPYERGNFIFELKIEEDSQEYQKRSPFLQVTEKDLQSEKTIGDLKRRYLGDKKIMNPILAIQLIYKGKVLPDNQKLRELDFQSEKDNLTIMTTRAKNRAKPVPPLWNNGTGYCVTLVWHPNIESSIPPGKENFHLGMNWNPNVDLTGLILGIKKVMHMDPSVFDAQNCLNQEAGEQYLNDREKFDSKARKWTEKYARN